MSKMRFFIENLYFNIYNWTPKKICSIRYTQYVYIWFCDFGLPGNDCTKDNKKSRRSRSPSAGDFFGCFGVLSTVISWKSKIKYTHIEYIWWTIFFSGSNYVLKYRFLMNFAKSWPQKIFESYAKWKSLIRRPRRGHQACGSILVSGVFFGCCVGAPEASATPAPPHVCPHLPPHLWSAVALNIK